MDPCVFILFVLQSSQGPAEKHVVAAVSAANSKVRYRLGCRLFLFVAVTNLDHLSGILAGGHYWLDC